MSWIRIHRVSFTLIHGKREQLVKTTKLDYKITPIDPPCKCRTVHHFDTGEHGRITGVPQEIVVLDTVLRSNMSAKPANTASEVIKRGLLKEQDLLSDESEYGKKGRVIENSEKIRKQEKRARSI